jgi:hypothetical protein
LKSLNITKHTFFFPACASTCRQPNQRAIRCRPDIIHQLTHQPSGYCTRLLWADRWSNKSLPGRSVAADANQTKINSYHLVSTWFVLVVGYYPHDHDFVVPDGRMRLIPISADGQLSDKVIGRRLVKRPSVNSLVGVSGV